VSFLLQDAARTSHGKKPSGDVATISGESGERPVASLFSLDGIKNKAPGSRRSPPGLRRTNEAHFWFFFYGKRQAPRKVSFNYLIITHFQHDHICKRF
jgi:hypothetical protein